MPSDVAPQAHDIVLKHLSQLFVGRTLEPLGLDTPVVSAAVPTELPEVSVRAHTVDYLFELADGTMLHLEFQSGRHAAELIRFLVYDALVFQRHRRQVRTAVVYTGRVRRADDRVAAGSLQYQVENVYLGAMDGDAALADLERRRREGALWREDALAIALTVLKRFTGRTRLEAVGAAMHMAAALPDEQSRTECQASVLGLAQQYLSQSQFGALAGVGDVSKALDRMIEEGWIRGRAEGKAEGKAEAVLLALRERFDNVPAPLVARVSRQRDGDVLERWLALAIKAPSLQAFERGLDG